MKTAEARKHLLERPPGRELFFAPLEVEFCPSDIERIEAAYIFSKFGHAKQVRVGGGRYFDHPKAAAWIYIDELNGRDVRTIIDILLHDLREDSYLLSPYRIKLNFGKDNALDVRAVTKLPKGKETINDYALRIISRGQWAILTKLCDVLHNARTLSVFPIEKQKRQIAEIEKYYLKLLVPALKNHEGIGAVHATMLEIKIKEAIRINKENIKNK